MMADKSLNFLVCCANGAGSSLMAQMALENGTEKIMGLRLRRFIIVRFPRAKRLRCSMML